MFTSLPPAMSRRIVLFIALLFAVLPARAQNALTEVQAVWPQAGYAPVALGGEGFGLGRPATPADAGTANPAAVAALTRPVAGVALGTAGVYDWYPGVRVGPGTSLLPSAAVVVPVGPWRVGLAFTRLIAQSFRYLPMEIGTPEEPEGTGEHVRPVDRGYLAALGPVLARELRSGPHALALGARGAWVHGRHESDFGTIAGSGTVDGFGWAAGASYALHDGPGGRRLAEAGVAYEHRIHATGTLTMEGPEIDFPFDGAPPVLLRTRLDLAAVLPARLAFDAAVSPLPTLTARAAVAFVGWSGVSDNYRDRPERSFSLVWAALPALSVSAGYHDADRDLFGSNPVGEVFGRSARYVTAGAVVRTGPWRLDLGVADSHLFPRDRTFRHTLARAALTRAL